MFVCCCYCCCCSALCSCYHYDIYVCVCVSEISPLFVVILVVYVAYLLVILIFLHFLFFSPSLFFSLSFSILVLFPLFLCRMLALQSAEDDERRQFLPYFSSCVPLLRLLRFLSFLLFLFYLSSFGFFLLLLLCLLLHMQEKNARTQERKNPTCVTHSQPRSKNK